MLHYPTQQRVSVFLAFQSQACPTHDQTGHAIADPEPGGPEVPRSHRPHRRRAGQPGRPGTRSRDRHRDQRQLWGHRLAGWSILDREKRQLVLDGGVCRRETRSGFVIGPPVALGNSGGLITLRNPDRLKVDGVATSRPRPTPKDGA